jgi:hypothetical protein
MHAGNGAAAALMCFTPTDDPRLPGQTVSEGRSLA